MPSFNLVANVEMASANCSSGECSIAVGCHGKTTVSPDAPKTVVESLFEGCLEANRSSWIGGTSISTYQGGKIRERGWLFPVR